MFVASAHLDVDPVEVETSLGKVFQFLAQELVLFKLVVMMFVRGHGGVRGVVLMCVSTTPGM